MIIAHKIISTHQKNILVIPVRDMIVTDSLSLLNVGRFYTEALKLVQQASHSTQKIVVDLSRVDDLHSAGIGYLIKLRHRIEDLFPDSTVQVILKVDPLIEEQRIRLLNDVGMNKLYSIEVH